MAGIGVRLNKIYRRKSVISNLYGLLYSVVVTIAPMLLVLAAVMLTQHFLGFSDVGYAARKLFSCTVLYILDRKSVV